MEGRLQGEPFIKRAPTRMAATHFCTHRTTPQGKWDKIQISTVRLVAVVVTLALLTDLVDTVENGGAIAVDTS
jgi:hypothetical protein